MKQQLKQTNLQKLVADCVKEKPWVAFYMDKSYCSKMVTAPTLSFNKYQKSLMHMLSKIEKRAEPYKSLLDFFDNSEEYALAVLIQNCLHPKNNMRVDAIKAGAYVEIVSAESARDYVEHLLEKNLTIELKSVESKVKQKNLKQC